MLPQSNNIGNKDETALTPEKLASFYKAVGGNYDCASLALAPLSTFTIIGD
jgi:hypothetical protein